eukprot:TRINITY_DN2805_c0_g2_i1.p1 TRINITY_DN2805_c0_g2~~TRINITY_DN2805_c0_g2_i1.p1  ORF type:complete len:220 (-),score=69.92 TRINITY_DN2805_c0_g2_i1:40-621(-)
MGAQWVLVLGFCLLHFVSAQVQIDQNRVDPALCRPYSVYSKDVGFATSRCRASIEKAGAYSIDSRGDNIWQYDPTTCRAQMNSWAQDRDAWIGSDCTSAILDLCCWNRYRICNASIPNTVVNTNVGKTCKSACFNTGKACRLAFDGDQRCDGPLYQDGTVNGNLPCTGAGSLLSINYILMFFSAIVVFALVRM